jgi:UbiD family decarboxylase
MKLRENAWRRPLPSAAIVIIYSSRRPPAIGEFLFTGFLRKKPLEVVQCKTVDVRVPAEAEFVLEGFVDPGERRTEGPFGDHTGYYSEADEYPVFHITAITHRKDAIYPATLVGRPPQEDAYLGKATERIFASPSDGRADILDMDMPVGVFQCVIVKIRKRYRATAKVIHTIWGQRTHTLKFVIVCDDDVMFTTIRVTWKVMNHVDRSAALLLRTAARHSGPCVPRWFRRQDGNRATERQKGFTDLADKSDGQIQERVEERWKMRFLDVTKFQIINHK